MLLIARSVVLIISRMSSGDRAASRVWRRTAGSFRTCPISGFSAMMACICGLLWIMVRISSGLLMSDCIMGELIISRIISGFCIICCCIFPPPPAMADARLGGNPPGAAPEVLAEGAGLVTDDAGGATPCTR